MSLDDRFTAAAPPATLDLAQALNDLEHTHSELVAALDAMERATQAPTPDKSDYSNARWKLSVASRNRRSLAGKICQQLMPGASPKDAQTLKELYSADVKMLHESAAHVGAWTLETIETRWTEYCAASREIRSKMMLRIAAERTRLFQIIERAAR